MLTGDLGRTAVLARHDALASARLTLFQPLTSMLASPVADEAEALRRMDPPIWVEDKYDGIRAQLHKEGRQVRLFSRDLNDLTGQFPEVVRAAQPLPWDGILDGEILGWKDGAALPFLELQSRLGRKAPSEAILARVPVIYVAFDALALAGGERGAAAGADVTAAADAVGVDASRVEPLLRLPLRERRARLEALGLDRTPGFGLAALTAAADADELTRIFGEAQARGNEGLMLKDPASPYAPGRRGYAWLKLKKALTTLDCVVVGVEVGHGRRHGVLSDYTFAVLDDRPGAVRGRPGDHRQGLLGPLGRRDRGANALVRSPHHQPARSLPGRGAGRRGGDRLRCRAPLCAPRLGLRAALPTHRATSRRQASQPDRPPEHGRGAPRAAAGRRSVRCPHRSARPGMSDDGAMLGPAERAPWIAAFDGAHP